MIKQNLTLILCASITLLLQINDIRAENEFMIDARIINGTDATLAETRHQVSIRRSKDSSSFGDGHICGGSLISDNVVLTAAHCLTDNTGSFVSVDDYIVVAGTLDRLKRDKNTLVFGINKIIKYAEQFNTITLDYDIVLLLLNGTVPANHPTAKQILLHGGTIKNNTLCRASGWGLNEKNVRPDKLKIINQTYYDVNTCRKNLSFGSRVHDGMLCAGFLETGRAPCTADSGGPLVCGGIQAGVVSWGVQPCATPSMPTVYADVAYFENWILKEVASHNGTLPKFASIPDGVTGLSCSIILVSSMLIFSFIFGQVN